MKESYRYLHLDVFTGRLFGGNQLAVVLDGRGLAVETMQAIAKEMNFSETTFVFPPEQPGTDLRVRIFTPAEELPMAGHPTIGTAFALAHEGVLPSGREAVIFGLGVGPTPVSLVWKDGRLSFAWMTQRVATFGAPLGDRAGAAAALGLDEGDLDASGPVQVGSSGAPFLLVPLASREAVDRAGLDQAAYARFCRTSGQDLLPVFLFTSEVGSDAATVYSRMFAPGFGIAEDPATGGACGPLGCYLVRNKLVTPDEAAAMLSLQGVRMGRPSHVHVSVVHEQGEITSVRVGGESVVAGDGTLYL